MRLGGSQPKRRKASWKTKLEKMMYDKYGQVYEKEVFSEYTIDQMWKHFLEGDLQFGVLSLAIEMRERFIEEKVESMRGPMEARTAEEIELLQDMLDYLLRRVDLFYTNGEDIRAAFDQEFA